MTSWKCEDDIPNNQEQSEVLRIEKKNLGTGEGPGSVHVMGS